MAQGVPALHPERRGKLNVSPKANWVERKGGLPPYINSVATALVRGGMSRSHAIQTAINVVKKTCATGFWRGNPKSPVSDAIKAAACAAVAQWEGMKLSDTEQSFIELAETWEPETSLDLADLHRTIELAWEKIGERLKGIELAQARRRIIDLAWDEAAHPRAEKGQTGGGRWVQAGDKGKDARKVRRKLKRLGKNMTEADIRQFQKDHGLQVDGKVGRQTLIALNAATATNSTRRENLMQKAKSIEPGALTGRQRRHLRHDAPEPDADDVRREARGGGGGKTKTEPRPSQKMGRRKAQPASQTKKIKAAEKAKKPIRTGGAEDSQPGFTKQLAGRGWDFHDGTWWPPKHPKNFKRKNLKRARNRGLNLAVSMKADRFPVRNRSDLQKAIHAVGRATDSSGQHSEAERRKVRRHIIRRARALGAISLIPSSWGPNGSLKSAQ